MVGVGITVNYFRFMLWVYCGISYLITIITIYMNTISISVGDIVNYIIAMAIMSRFS